MVRVLAEMAHTELAALLESDLPLVAILPVGATEAHGPHLPLNTDVVISEGFGQRAAEILEESGTYQAIMLPPLAYTPAEYASEFPGTISISSEAHSAILNGIGAALKSQGFACLAIANSHFDPANVKTLREASERIRESGLPVAFPDATRRHIAEELTEEFKSGDCHGGQFESSLVMALRPELVNNDTIHGLPENKANLIQAIKERGPDARFGELGMDQAYCGTPAGASPEEGIITVEILANAMVLAVQEALTAS